MRVVMVATLTGLGLSFSAAVSAAAGTWEQVGDMAVARAQSHTLTALPDGRALVVGGLVGANAELATRVTELYDPATRSWSPTGDLLVARSRHIASLLPDGRVLVAGGLANLPDGTSAVTATAELYDPATGHWSATGSMRRPRANFAAATLVDGRVLVTGGVVDTAPFTEKSAEIYDPATRAWSPVAKMANGRYVHRATALADGRVLVAGGSEASHCTARDTAEVYDAAIDAWVTVTSMPEAHTTHIQERLPDGRVVVAGGWSLPQRGCGSDGRIRNSTSASNLYEPLAGTWTPTSPLNVARAASATLSLADGRVIAAGGAVGGEDRNTRTDTAEIFAPTIGAWVLTGSMVKARSAGRGALLHDGRVLVAGGNAPGPQASAELFTP